MTTQNVIHVASPTLLALCQAIREEGGMLVDFQDGDASVIGSLQELLDKATAEFQSLDQTIEGISVDADTSDKKKTELAIEAVAHSYGKLDFVKKALETRQGAMNDARNKLMAPPPSKTDATTDFLVGQEIRTRLLAQPMADRMRLVQKAMEAGYTEILRAVELDPLHMDIIEPEFFNRLKNEHAEASNGAAWNRLQSLQFATEKLGVLTTAIDLSLKNFGTVPTFGVSPLHHADLKLKDTSAPAPKSKADAPAVGALT